MEKELTLLEISILILGNKPLKIKFFSTVITSEIKIPISIMFWFHQKFLDLLLDSHTTLKN
jgi:hypothetical protein